MISDVGSAVSWTVEVGGEQTTAVWDPPSRTVKVRAASQEPPDSRTGKVRAASPGSSGVASPVFVCAHGAGGQMNDRSMLSIRDALTAAGLGVVRFNFLYRAKGSARPDPMPRLLACWSAVADRVRRELQPEILILGGRSMGGRAASMLVADPSTRSAGSGQDGAACDGLLLLAYPLHPPGATDKLRADHLSKITVPVLCFNGTRDAFCERPLMERVLSNLTGKWRMHWLDDADHGFHVLKRSGRTDADVLQEVARETRDWLASAVRPAGSGGLSQLNL